MLSMFAIESHPHIGHSSFLGIIKATELKYKPTDISSEKAIDEKYPR